MHVGPEDSSRLRLGPMTVDRARVIVQWRYGGEYAMYNVPEGREEEALADLMREDHAYHTIEDEAGNLVAYCCFGFDAQVPGGDYGNPGLDLGLGVRPDLTGKGKGRQYVAAVVDYALGHYGQQPLRVSVAAWNERARKVWTRAGFRIVGRFVRSVGSPLEFVQMVKPADR